MAGTDVLLLLLGATTLLIGTSAQRSRVRGQNMKVRINATGDTIVMKFVRPSADVKLEGYILGYGSSVFSKQFFHLPENGRVYETELDAEPKYLVAVQPIPANNVKKHCTGKVDLEKPLHVVLGSVSPTAVLLSWGNHLKTPYEGNIMNECLADGFYTIRYRERNRKWNYQMCPTSDTVVDNLKPNTAYEFGVRSNSDERSGTWSRPVLHNTNMRKKNPHKTFKLRKTLSKSLMPAGALVPPRPDGHVHSDGNLVPMTTVPLSSSASDNGNNTKRPLDPGPSVLPLLQSSSPSSTSFPSSMSSPSSSSSTSSSPPLTDSDAAEKRHSPEAFEPQDKLLQLRKALSSQKTEGQSKNLNPAPKSSRPASGNPVYPVSNGFRHSGSSRHVHGQLHRGVSPPKPLLWQRHRLGSPVRPLIPNKRPNLVGKPGDSDKVNNFKQTDNLVILKPKVLPSTGKPTKPERRASTTTTPMTTAASRHETWEDSDLFKSQPTSDLDAQGKKRYVAPHVIYQTGKRADEPCSITSSLNFFPQNERSDANFTTPPKTPPSNLTVVTVEGCPSFIILDWEKTDNDTTEYEVISTAKGPDGEQVSVLTTDQTHTAVENLKPESSYEFKVKPKNELGAGPHSEPVSFNTESADPRVSENISGKFTQTRCHGSTSARCRHGNAPVSAGKDAIWTQFPFKTDSYSDCHGQQFVKRTWYRKFVGVQLCNSLRYKIYLSDSLTGKFYNIGDQTGFGEDHCQFVDSFLEGKTGRQLRADQLPSRPGFYRAVRQEPVHFGLMGGHSHVSYVSWYECGTPIPGKW
uniref:target of Nesh-SH3-like isoform X2 n=1 Tax=Solea senegalensis TaxID=28829 RepID=UPI001CD87B4B|nr:target of Nesh-SH3-like isoform X2 [Solea senegalensis]